MSGPNELARIVHEGVLCTITAPIFSKHSRSSLTCRRGLLLVRGL